MIRCKKPSYSLHPKLVFKWCQWCKLLWCYYDVYLFKVTSTAAPECFCRVGFLVHKKNAFVWILGSPPAWRHLGSLDDWGTFDPFNKVDRFGSGKTMENPMCLGVYPKGFVYILTTLAVPKLSSFRPISSVFAGRLWSPATWRLSIWKLRKERWWLPSPER